MAILGRKASQSGTMLKVWYNSNEPERQSLGRAKRKVRAAQGTVVANGDRP